MGNQGTCASRLTVGASNPPKKKGVRFNFSNLLLCQIHNFLLENLENIKRYCMIELIETIHIFMKLLN